MTVLATEFNPKPLIKFGKSLIARYAKILTYVTPFASLKKQAETLLRLICCEIKILFRLKKTDYKRSEQNLCSANPELGTLCNFVAPVMKFGFTVVEKN